MDPSICGLDQLRRRGGLIVLGLPDRPRWAIARALARLVRPSPLTPHMHMLYRCKAPGETREPEGEGGPSERTGNLVRAFPTGDAVRTV